MIIQTLGLKRNREIHPHNHGDDTNNNRDDGGQININLLFINQPADNRRKTGDEDNRRGRDSADLRLDDPALRQWFEPVVWSAGQLQHIQ